MPLLTYSSHAVGPLELAGVSGPSAASRPLSWPESAWMPAAPAYSWTHVALPPDLATLRAEAAQAPEQLFEFAHATFLRALHAQAPNTQRAYAADWKSFVTFCRTHGYPALPAHPAVLEAFIEVSCEYSPEVPYKRVAAATPRRNLKASSVKRAIAAIGAVHEWLHYPSPAAHPDVKHTLKINTRGRSAKEPKAPLPWTLIEQALATYGETLADLRAKALVTLAFSTLLRRCELVALQVEDFQPTADGDDGLVRVRKTKGDQAGPADERYVTPAARRHLEVWLAGTRLTTGPIFARLNRNGTLLAKALHPNQVALIMKDIARRAGLSDHEVARIAAHSTRIGATYELGRHGASLAQLMRAGGWASPQMPATYLRESDVKVGAMAQWARGRAVE
jgi:integrase